jgi:5-aminolevulinate synthase
LSGLLWLGGYTTASATLIDAVRSYAPGFIFATPLPPAICAAATVATRHLKTSQWERQRQQDRTRRVKTALGAAALPVMLSDTHIAPVAVGDLAKCKAASDLLLSEHGIYPADQLSDRGEGNRAAVHYAHTVPRGHYDRSARCGLIDVWNQLGLPRHNLAYAAE